MHYNVHLFLGGEFEKVLGDVAEYLLRDGEDNLKYNHIFMVRESSDKTLHLHKLEISSQEGNTLTQSIQVGWTELSPVKSANEWSEIFVSEVYDKILTASVATQMTLPVFLHFPFYKASSVKMLEIICSGIQSSARAKSSEIAFVGLGDDMVKLLEPEYTIKSPSAKQVAAFDALRESQRLSKQTTRFIFLHNSTMGGINLGMQDKETFAEFLNQLILLLGAFYEQLLPMEALDVTALGFSSLNFNKYQFAKYLLQKATLLAIDNSSVNSQDVDVNKVFSVVNELLRGKDETLSRFFKDYEGSTDSTAHEKLQAVVDEIKTNVMRVCSQTKDITFKTAILAALLSKTEYELFSSSVYNASNSCYLDLYSEPIDYFINEDEAKFYSIDDESPVNPIKKMKEINRSIINSETEIRNLEKRLAEQEKQIETSEKVQQCIIDDEFISFQDKKFKLLPNVIEEPLQETYVAKECKVESVDLRKNFTEIKNQGQQGSCLSFTVTSIFEYMMKMNDSKDYDLSEAFLYYNARNLDDVGDVSTQTDTGSRFKPTMDSLTKYGLCLEQYCRYDDGVYDRCPSDEAYADAGSRKLIKALNVERNVEAIKSALAEGYPVAASFTLCESFYPSKGYIKMPSEQEIAQTLSADANEENAGKHTRHAMAIVGFSDQLNMFVVRNSWGKDWGDNGYCYIPYEYIAHEQLFNFACIITEVASIANAKPELKEVAALKVDNKDVRIRYYITKAALERERKLVEHNIKERSYWLEYFETIKTSFSTSSNLDEYIKANETKMESDKLVCESAIKTAEDKQETLREEWYAFRNKWLIRCGIAIAAIFLLWFGANLGFKAIGVAFRFSYLWALILSGICAGITTLKINTKHSEWIEQRDALDNDIMRSRKEISRIAGRFKQFRFRSFAAWTMMKSLETTQDYLLNVYNNMISLINNLRVWYSEVKQSNNEMDLDSRFPYISLLDRDILDKYFDEHLSHTNVCDVDLCDGIDNYDISGEFLSQFKSDFTAKLLDRLVKSLETVDFNISSHTSCNSHANMAKVVTPDVLQQLSYQSNIFVHLDLRERGDVAFNRMIFAPNLDEYENELRVATCALCSVSDYRSSEDRYRLTLATTASLNYSECAQLR